jgi:hypothetical protein
MMIDTLKLANRLNAAGMERGVAEALADELSQQFREETATKTDIRQLRTEMASKENLRTLYWQVVATVAVFFAVHFIALWQWLDGRLPAHGDDQDRRGRHVEHRAGEHLPQSDAGPLAIVDPLHRAADEVFGGLGHRDGGQRVLHPPGLCEGVAATLAHFTMPFDQCRAGRVKQAVQVIVKQVKDVVLIGGHNSDSKMPATSSCPRSSALPTQRNKELGAAQPQPKA